MTGHSINAEQNQEFLSTMHTMIDDLDTISSNIDEVIYLRLANGLQRLYNIHNSTIQTSSTNNRETPNQRQRERYRENFQTNNENNEVEITRILARHYGRVYDSSGVLINNDIATVNADDYPLNTDAYPINADANDYINVNYDSWNENNPAQNWDNASTRISYTSVTSNHWIETALREGLHRAH
jgi:hypothetical protein